MVDKLSIFVLSVGGAVFLTGVLTLLLLLGPRDGSEHWTVQFAAGKVEARTEAGMRVPLVGGRELHQATQIETGEAGRVILTRGPQTISLGPQTVLTVHPNEGGSRIGHMVRRLVTWRIEGGLWQEPAPAEAPYLAAVVKG